MASRAWSKSAKYAFRSYSRSSPSPSPFSNTTSNRANVFRGSRRRWQLCGESMRPLHSAVAAAKLVSHLAVSSSNSGALSLEMWWTHFGGDTPDLQRLAIRILSQTCSASGCERNWSAFEKIHSKKRNRMTTQRLHDTVYVYVNLRLYVKQLEHKDNSDGPIDLSTIDPTFSDAPSCDVEEEQEDQVNQEFRAAWIDMEEDIDRMADMGVDLDQGEEEVEEEEEDVLGDVVHFEDPLPPVDFGVGPLEQIDPDAETLPADESPSQPLSYARRRPRIRGSAFGLAPQARYARATSRAPSPSTSTSRALSRGSGSGGRLTNKRAR